MTRVATNKLSTNFVDIASKIYRGGIHKVRVHFVNITLILGVLMLCSLSLFKTNFLGLLQLVQLRLLRNNCLINRLETRFVLSSYVFRVAHRVRNVCCGAAR